MTLWNNVAELVDYYIPPMPSEYWADITRACNLRCVMCPQSDGLSQPNAEMSMSMFRQLIDDVCENRPLIKLYMSGEPLLHENLFDMIDYAASKACRTAVHTNATTLTSRMAEKILASPLSSISFSFDGCSPEVYEKLRPPASFQLVRSNLRQYLDLRRRSPNGGPRTCIEIIRMQETEGLIDAFVDEWKASGVDEVKVVDYMMWHGRMEDRRVPGAGELTAYKPCAAPFQHGCVLADGTVVPCCLDVDGERPLGNITMDRFRDIWIGNAYRQLRLEMLTGTLPPDSICCRCLNTIRAT
ncbi:MAG: radical SAM protein [Phycisphaerae bacterium]|nr:radical SAM protein [Phycisphaerae bacterium]